MDAPAYPISVEGLDDGVLPNPESVVRDDPCELLLEGRDDVAVPGAGVVAVVLVASGADVMVLVGSLEVGGGISESSTKV